MKRREVYSRQFHGLLVRRCLFLLLLAGGCHDAQSGLNRLPPEGGELTLLRQVNRTHSHETRAMQLVIRNAGTLAQVPLQDVPVDFANEMLLIVTLGRVYSDLYSVKIDRVWREGHRLRVKTTVEVPPANAPLVMASPYCIAVVPRCGLNVDGFALEPPTRIRSWGQSEPGWGP